MARFITVHTLYFKNNVYEKHEPVTLNVAHIVAVQVGHLSKDIRHASIRMVGDGYQDWTNTWETFEQVIALVCPEGAEHVA